ncbi:flagellar hook-length control protein FliK [Marinomonas algicola]|uniref:flagellar hook-length control protein FliK n=1 Tax=Marinomonas algicola TaxID=2773454 RepID=UPI001748E74A|nr:flagellar hook-length control protein FliK [Marinomonas algicola]
MLTQLDNFVSSEASRKNVSQSLGESRAFNSNARDLSFADALDRASHNRIENKEAVTKKNANQGNSTTGESRSEGMADPEKKTPKLKLENDQDQNTKFDKNADSKAANDELNGGNALPKTDSDVHQTEKKSLNTRDEPPQKEVGSGNIRNALPTYQEYAANQSSSDLVQITINEEESANLESASVEQLSNDVNTILSLDSELVDSNESDNGKVAINELAIDLNVDDNESSPLKHSGTEENLFNVSAVENLHLNLGNTDTVEEQVDSIILSLSDDGITESLAPVSDDVTLEDKLKQILQLANNGEIDASVLNDLVPGVTSDGDIETSAADELGPVNLTWILGEMNKQSVDSVGVDKEGANQNQEGVIHAQGMNSLFKSSNTVEHVSSGLDPDSLKDESAPLFVTSLKSDNKTTMPFSNEFKLPLENKLPQPEADPSIDEFISSEFIDNELLKKSALLESKMDSLQASNLDSKLVTPLSTASGSTAFTITSQGVQVSSQSSLTMTALPNDPNWPQEMQEKVRWIMKEGMQTAEIHLDPPELGSLTVKVSLDSDGASVSFSAATPQARDLLENQIQRLRELLAQQGIDLSKVDVNVSQGQQQGQHQEEGGEGNLSKNSGLGAELDDIEEVNTSYINATGVDFYA